MIEKILTAPVNLVLYLIIATTVAWVLAERK